jgi:hypothetical protein
LSRSLDRSLSLIGITPDGHERAFVVGVGKPVRQHTGEWACPTLSPDDSKPIAIYGEDSLQALCLGLSFIRLRLEDFLEKGGRLLLTEDREDLSPSDIASWFSQMGS